MIRDRRRNIIAKQKKFFQSLRHDRCIIYLLQLFRMCFLKGINICLQKAIA